MRDYPPLPSQIAPATTSQSEMAAAVATQEQAVAGLLDALAELKARLTPVLVPTPATQCDKCGANGYGSPLANAIGDHTTRIEEARATVATILSELAV